jgi:hypothetical protein
MNNIRASSTNLETFTLRFVAFSTFSLTGSIRGMSRSHRTESKAQVAWIPAVPMSISTSPSGRFFCCHSSDMALQRHRRLLYLPSQWVVQVFSGRSSRTPVTSSNATTMKHEIDATRLSLHLRPMLSHLSPISQANFESSPQLSSFGPLYIASLLSRAGQPSSVHLTLTASSFQFVNHSSSGPMETLTDPAARLSKIPSRSTTRPYLTRHAYHVKAKPNSPPTIVRPPTAATNRIIGGWLMNFSLSPLTGCRASDVARIVPAKAIYRRRTTTLR